MHRCGRHFAFWCAAFIFAGTRTYLASSVAPEQTKSQRSSTQACPQENRFQVEEEGQSCTPLDLPAPRISLASLHQGGYVQPRLVLPLRKTRTHEPGQQGMVHKLRATLQPCEVVAQNCEPEQIPEQETEARTPEGEEDRWNSNGTRSFNAFWYEGGRGSDWRRGWSSHSSVGQHYAQQNYDHQNAEHQWTHTYGTFFSREGQGEGQGEGCWSRPRIAAEASAGEATAGSQGYRGYRSAQQSYGRGRDGPRTSGSEVDPQGGDAATESREEQRSFERRNLCSGHSLERVARVHDQEAPGAEDSVFGEERIAADKVRRGQDKDHGPQDGDQVGGRIHDRGQRGAGYLPEFRRRPSTFLRASGSHRGLRRGSRDDSCRRRRKAEVADPVGTRIAVEDKEDVKRRSQVTFNPTVSIGISNLDNHYADVLFLIESEALDHWDSKPWAMHSGTYVDEALEAILCHGQGRSGRLCHGDPRRAQGCDLLDYAYVELYALGRDSRETDELGGRGLLQGFDTAEKRRQIRTFGLHNWPCGQRTWTEPTIGGDVAPTKLARKEILHIIAELWTELWHLFPRVYLAGLQESEHCVNLDFIVEFLGEETAMCNVPVLIESMNCETLRKKSFAAYVDHIASWRSIAAVCGLDSSKMTRKGNGGVIWIGNRVVVDDQPFLVLPGMRVTFEAPMDMERSDGDGPHGTKRARLGGEAQPSSSSRPSQAVSSQEVPADGPSTDQGSDAQGGIIEAEEPFAHLFHHYTDHARSRLTPARGPNLGRLAFQRRARVAEIWGIPVDHVMGLHPVRARPYDIPNDEEILITRWRADDYFKRWQDDVQVLLDLVIDGSIIEQPIKRRSVRWIRSVMSRMSILRWLRIDDYCTQVSNDQCRVWINNDELLLAEGRQVRMQMGDYVRVVVPEDESRSVLEHGRALRRRERLQQQETFFTDLSPTSSGYEEDEESDESGNTDASRRTVEEPEPHAAMDEGTQEISLLEALDDVCGYRPPPVGEPTVSDLPFDEVWDLLVWLDSAITQPSWMPPAGFVWPDCCWQWLEEDWWMLQHVDELRFYTDGSKASTGAGAAVVLFVRSGENWHYGGYLSQPCAVACAHYSELLALTMSFHWLNNLLMYCALSQSSLPDVTFAFDATSAGYKAFGNWSATSYVEEAENIRSVWFMITHRYNFHWSLEHVRSHQGEPGNEMADLLAKAASGGNFACRSTSTWGQYLMLTRDANVKWLWALWKPEWKAYWEGRALHLPQEPSTTPDTACLNHVGTSREDISQWARFHCNVATANVLSLMPNSKKMNPMGLQGKARTESIMQMAQEAQLHIVGLQETRVKKLPKSDTEHYFVFGGAASQSGHYGTQLWFSKSHALDVDNRCFFERSHFKILCQGERILSIRVWAPFFRAVVVCAHAPHTQHAEEDRKMWWENLKNSTPHKYKDWPHVLLIDANARVGEFPNQHVGDHQGDLQDSNGDYLTEYLMEYNLWLPSTFDTVHEGAGGTWHHHNKDSWCRGDYVALPMQWQLEFCHSAVRPDIDITLTKQDHQVVYAGFRWQGLTSSGSKRPSWSYVKYDTAGLIDYFKGKDGDSWRNSLRSILPDCDWSTDVHSHTAFLQRNLAHWMQNSCGPLRATPKKKTMSQETWTLVQRKRALRREFFDNSASRRRSTLRAVFDCWNGKETLWPLETKDEAHKAAQDLHELQGLSRQVTAALRKDDVAYFQNVAASMGDADDPTAGQNIWRKIRWALPKFKQRSQQSPLLLDSLDDQWYGHFADLEAGHMVTPEELLQRCTTRQRKRARQPVKSLSLLPTLVDTEKVLRRVQANKTPGPDQLPNSLYKHAASVLAPAVHDVYLKTYTWECEAVQCKGGWMVPIYKSGDREQARSYRGIMLLSTLGKCFHSWVRQQLMAHITDVRLPTQIGGFSHQQSQFGSQCIQTIARICCAKQLSHACLFVDVRGAYHYLIRELVLGIEDNEDLKAVIASITAQGMDPRGVERWSSIPGILERVKADPKLVSLLREIHTDTWMSMARTGDTMRTRRGSRPGSPVADAIYHVLMMDIHIEIHRILESYAPVLSGFEAASIPVSAITWADDLAVPIITVEADDLISAIQEVTSKVFTAFERRGLELNLQKNKTAAVLSFKGRHAPALRKLHLLGAKPGTWFKASGDRQLWLHYTGMYRHLGAVFCADGIMDREVQARIGAASASFRQLRKLVFGNRKIQVPTRLKLLDALIFSKLTYGLSTWSSLGVGMLAKVETFMLRCQRFVCGFDLNKSNDEFCGRYNVPGLHLRLMQHRLIYAAAVWTHGPPLLQDLLLLEEDTVATSWMTTLRHDLTCCQDLLREDYPGQTTDIDELKLYWRTSPQLWRRKVKKAYRRATMQECAAAEARGWHAYIIAELKSNGATFKGGLTTSPGGDHVCHCGKVCQTAQGLAVHKWKMHGEHAPEYKFAKGAHCPVCLKWLWTSHRVRMHLAYIPRSGKPNPCFQVLQQAGGEIDENMEIVKAPPSRVAGMRLDALNCNGPFAPYPREVDNLQCQAESELDELQRLRTNYPTYDSIDLEIVEKFSGNFGQALEQWRLYHGQGDPEGYELWNIFIDLFAEFETPVETFEFVFIEWYRHIFPDLLGQWEDGGLEVIAENTLYGLTQEMEYMKITTRVDVLQNQLRGLQKKRQQEDEAPPHRPVRLGPMNRRGGIRQFKPALRRYLNEDKWQEQCEALQWETSVKDKETPVYMQVANKPCYLIVHLFSGRRRSLDYHDAVMRLAEGKSFEVRVISLDTAVHSTIGDLSAGKETWGNIEELARAGRLAGALAGPPCETFTEARHHLPPDLPPEERKFWPRPLRSAKAPWGLDGLTYKEMLQLRTGTRFALQVAWLFVAMLCYGGHMMIEHPGPPRDGEKVSIFRTPIYALLLRLPECALRIIRQQFWGAAAVKPTGILALRLPYFYASMNKWKMASEDLAAVEPAIGRNRDGSFKTSGLKEYPALLSQGLAQCSVDALQRISMTGVSRQSSHTVNHHLLKWCEAALKATEQIDETAAMMPDYQG